MKIRIRRAWTASCCVFFLITCSVHAEHLLTTLPLNGTWKFRLDAEDVGVAEKWFTQQFEDTVQLPGTTDENHKGVKKDEQCIDRLSRVWYWKGPAWYQRRVAIPDVWEGKRIT
ncbi:MAG: sugar-binding domain-containing protein, partial [Planctomycetota bacterium]